MFSAFQPRRKPLNLPTPREMEMSPFEELLSPHLRLQERLRYGSKYQLFLGHTSEGRAVAVRGMNREWWSQHPSGQPDATFLLTVERRRRLPHPLQPTILAAGAPQGWVYFARPWLEGPDLLQRERPTLSSALEQIAQIASALNALHELGSLHGNLRPSNLLWDGPQLYLTDAELPRSRLQMPSGWRRDAFDLEDYYPAPPEQLAGQEAGIAGELYGFGVLIYRLLTGRLPYLSEGLLGWLEAATTQQPRSLLAEGMALSENLDQLFLRLLSKDPQQRPDCKTVLTTLKPSAPSGEIPDPVHRWLGEATLAEENLTFQLDPQRAHQQLRLHRFLEPGDFWIPLLAAADQLGCACLQVGFNQREYSLHYDGPEFSPEQLQQLLLDPRPSHLRAGISGLLADGCDLEIRSGSSSVRLQGQQPPRWDTLQQPVQGLLLYGKVAGPQMAPQEPRLAHCFRYARIPVLWNGRLLNSTPPFPWVHDGCYDGATYQIRARPQGQTASLALVAQGLAFRGPQEYLVGGLETVIEGPWQADLSYRELVFSPHHERALQQIAPWLRSLSSQGEPGA